jgi:hypothetical protein
MYNIFLINSQPNTDNKISRIEGFGLGTEIERAVGHSTPK